MTIKQSFEGIVSIRRDHNGVLWSDPLNRKEPYFKLDRQTIKNYGLVNGVRVKAAVNGRTLNNIISVCGSEPQAFKSRRAFSSQPAAIPDQRFDFGSTAYASLRIIDMFMPIGFGTRALIVSPPRAGKTVILEEMAKGLREINQKLRIIALLIDERPEEVTGFKMKTDALVLHRTLDQSTRSQVELSNLLIDHIQAEVEAGNDIVVLIDSLTRLSRSYNRSDNRSRGRTMSGGVGAGALEIPRKLFGLARNIQRGGSCTILATILRDTGSRMDEVIFQEFKGTGNSEIILDRELAENRIFPALNLRESGTRKEELLLDPNYYETITALRRKLFTLNKDSVIVSLLNLFEKYVNNKELLDKYSAEISG